MTESGPTNGSEPADDPESADDPETATDSETSAGSTTTVVAQGTFDVLHPGHVHYLEDAAARGDELHVIVARSSNVTHKAPPVVPGRQRRDVVAALEAVDHARLGDDEDIFVPIEEIDPDVIVLGYDQHHDEDDLAAELERRGIDCRLERASPRPKRYDEELLSTGRIVDRVLEERD